ncbi:SDR family NAD(P)-dependent oxidoreductase [Pseudobacter ginsenosidimutans]|uniref:NAD(P)-dependent dehydrogenase (Short-subunit alcohol dehydrogenase family) n=1 Tax=Pseudobacter ginsenosidimutans TaxID=661488 RepID=A0A4Q7N1X1_9BACT|nr:SDR family NAD(P)-dependent oxidoreductase [Pseudobacter ginsenosidimutans]QEC43812.1 SDR family NAD(P)-dependent oxidoreductase [Pseudobacter ginsenosidimutans]RZS75232.1 NAD(P)-dependent dehydrogenase (short-subunit alcohol dehydrogenase family) [Pseudobacter ginsenosidimutans]
MARIFITGSADGLGQLSARLLIQQGHEVVLHARNEQRGRDAMKNAPGAEAVFTGNLSSIEETKTLAAEVNASGSFDAVIHNAGIYQGSGRLMFSVNTLAPFILTCMMAKPNRLIYLSSGMHLQGRASFGKLEDNIDRISYSDTKLYVLMLSNAVARQWPQALSNAVDPGWVPTKMGGPGAPDDLQEGFHTQTWLAVSNDEKAMVSGRYFHHRKQVRHNPLADDLSLQDQLLEICERITGVAWPL